MPARQLVDGVGEVGFGVEAVELRGLDEGVEDGSAVTALVGPEEQEVLARDGDAAEQALGQIVVDGEAPVIGIAGQRIPAAQGILQRLAQRRLA